ncbi:hypothetical protein DWX95_04810 [Butyricicoccus sp. AF22-28AC]|nr:hypothetical protein DWX95_04810 [Butyricicoccus sp. AF22-28AC]
MRHTERCASEAVEKLSFSEQPLARNHAFERISKKNRVLRTHFFFPCINSEIHKVNCRIAAREGGLDHAPGIYEFAKQIRLNACYRTKHKNRILLFRQAVRHTERCASPLSSENMLSLLTIYHVQFQIFLQISIKILTTTLKVVILIL